MILYFSATGNSKYVASRIADATGETMLSIADCRAQEKYTFQDECIGIVSPTYDWALPSITREFLQQAKLEADYLYYVATYGTSPGASDVFAEKHLGKQIDAFFSVRMPDTWTPVFDLSTQEKVAAFSTTTEADIDAILRRLETRDCGQFLANRIPKAFVSLAYPFYELNRQTKHLQVRESCVGCGLCAKKCPVHAIEMKNSKPVWVKKQCVMCLGCLHRCPKFAIQYGNGKATQKHGQYLNSHVKV